MTPKARGTRSPDVRPPRPDLAPRKSRSRAAGKRATTGTLKSAGAVSFSSIMASITGEAPPIPAGEYSFPGAAASVAELMEELDRAILQGLMRWRRVCRETKSGYSEAQLTQALVELAERGDSAAHRAFNFNPAIAPVLEAIRLKDRLKVAQDAIASGDLEGSISGLVHLLRSVIRPAAGGLEGLANIARGRGAKDARKRGGRAPKPRPSKLTPAELLELRGKAAAIEKELRRRKRTIGREAIAARLALDSRRPMPVSNRRLVDLLWPPASRER